MPASPPYCTVVAAAQHLNLFVSFEVALRVHALLYIYKEGKNMNIACMSLQLVGFDQYDRNGHLTRLWMLCERQSSHMSVLSNGSRIRED